MNYKLVPVEPTMEQIVAGRDGIESLIGPGPEDQYCSEALLAYRAMLAAAPSPEWIQVSERLPTWEDADRDGYLWAYDGTEVHEINYTNVLIWSAWTHWMPKPRVTPPEPPK